MDSYEIQKHLSHSPSISLPSIYDATLYSTVCHGLAGVDLSSAFYFDYTYILTKNHSNLLAQVFSGTSA